MERVTGGHSIHAEAKDIGPHQCHWRVVKCNKVRDICECSKCGQQSEFACDFDDEYN